MFKKRKSFKEKEKSACLILGRAILAEEMALFCARIPKNGLKTAFRAENSNPCRKISRFFCKDCQIGVRMFCLTSPEELFLGEEAGDGYHDQGVGEAVDDCPCW